MGHGIFPQLVMKWAGDSDDYKARKSYIDIAHKTKANSDTFLILL
ncbi:MAG: hypothetical protein H6Q14_1590 [Bacteroidetes bacterium]|nr:hypothetical protein [Bacteroidota bacterium]